MHNAEFKTKQNTTTRELRQRKSYKKSSKSRKKMVGSGNEELLDHDLADVKMELLGNESDEDLSDDCDTKQLIAPSHSDLSNKKPDKSTKVSEEASDEENVVSTFLQILIPFALAGFGMVAASLLLDVVQHWPVFAEVSEVYILVPALLGLKGNLEMTLASRLSTQANLGHMDTKKQQWSLIVGNLALIQCQAMVVALLASLAAVALGWLPKGEFNIHHGLLLCASSLVTACIASFVLGLVMVMVILLSKRMNINPDNVATPIAASLGDLTTLALLAWISSFLYNAIAEAPWIAPIIIGLYVLVTPVWAFIAAKNPFTKEVLNHGWAPVIFAMLISSAGGLILDYTISSYEGIAVFQLVINGVGGNLAAVQASRISTSMHKQENKDSEETTVMCINPFYVFFSKGGHAKTARLLLTMVIPGHMCFSYIISYLKAGHTSFTPTFMAFYLTAAFLQVILLLYIARLLVVWMWNRGMDPDSTAIPYLTAAGDLIGTALLGIAFHLLNAIGDGDSDVGD
ncbi:solute carrier family 41 member 1-like [Trichogramma pretiosum]|uniref:solute carrier family 41 member 1-like n=1 Tax=Trichogramma pretiosum TaxID=7493 RepID=UPI0006C97F6E|nr:solute carrier family 41 member 1-like [Trichogramma pretiosum]XP_014222996.1 solute carrier family 41 member 1-like [Trichogramma pretiosum]XP_014222998.1 solute carrier family 41 member 1-like [Trichogramma pretiosum]XP_014222999.1 solute carrier family 41 member 1-like [Trichogramma pretiosum]XP_023315114.1 solute carrier family 41 member 1-like [Trichogramma pretiosum]XP_023315115.1 solute carrier family 41 member 1-like [Trichogramma pretiosum]XP_023315116.1 solute carrier family 41 m